MIRIGHRATPRRSRVLTAAILAITIAVTTSCSASTGVTAASGTDQPAPAPGDPSADHQEAGNPTPSLPATVTS
ncbi:MAG: hypothetical protein N2037_04185, partial [Acidimicrobiales bacterium]|nr:hypothetical protein [Acidimicrobiales bacterium]